jgi:hypothetical protein
LFPGPCGTAMEHRIGNTKRAKATQRSYVTYSLNQKVEYIRQGASSCGTLPGGADSLSRPGIAEETTLGRHSPVVKNLPLPSKGHTLGTICSGTPPQEPNISSKPVKEAGF